MVKFDWLAAIVGLQDANDLSGLVGANVAPLRVRKLFSVDIIL